MKVSFYCDVDLTMKIFIHDYVIVHNSTKYIILPENFHRASFNICIVLFCVDKYFTKAGKRAHVSCK